MRHQQGQIVPTIGKIYNVIDFALLSTNGKNTRESCIMWYYKSQIQFLLAYVNIYIFHVCPIMISLIPCFTNTILKNGLCVYWLVDLLATSVAYTIALQNSTTRSLFLADHYLLHVFSPFHPYFTNYYLYPMNSLSTIRNTWC